MRGDLHLTPMALAPTAVAKDGRLLVQVSTKDRWFWPAALLHPATGRLESVPLHYEGDLFQPGWAPDGSIVAMGLPLRSGIWRFRPEKAQP